MMRAVRSRCCSGVVAKRTTSLSRAATARFSSTTVYTWGNSKDGALGHEKFDEVTMEPRRLINSKKYKSVACGENFSLALDHSGNLFGWGVGPGSKFNSNTPFPIPTDRPMAKVFAGPRHAACIDEEGNLYTWGRQKGGWFSGGGQLGHGEDHKEIEVPMLLKSVKEYGAKVASVACGSEHTLIVTVDGEVLSCGVGEYGRLGSGNSRDSYAPMSLESLVSASVAVQQAAAGTNHSVALAGDGSVYTWGRNDAGQLGFRDTYIDIYSMEEFPRRISPEAFGGQKVVQVAASSGRSAAVTEGGDLFVWGRKQNHYPTRIDTSAGDAYGAADVHVEKVALGRDTSDRHCAFIMARSKKNPGAGCTLWSYGEFKSNMLGRAAAPRNNNPIPEVVEALQGRSVLDVCAGVGHGAAIVVSEA